MDNVKIPKKIHLFSHDIKTKWRRNLREKEDCIGLADFDTNTIYLQISTKKNIICKEKQEQTYFHELAHMMLHYSGRDDLMKDETLVDVLGSMLRQVVGQFVSDLIP